MRRWAGGARWAVRYVYAEISVRPMCRFRTQHGVLRVNETIAAVGVRGSQQGRPTIRSGAHAMICLQLSKIPSGLEILV